MYKYYLIYNGVKSEIDKEPIGWDQFETTISRNEKSHGIGIEYADMELKFYDDVSISILKTAYTDDIDSQVLFIVEYDDTEEYRGAVDFGAYNEVYAKFHYIAVKIGDIGIETTLFNRQEQKVNIDSLVAFDGAVLPSYPFLKKNITVPARSLLFTDDIKSEEDYNARDFHHGNSVDYKVIIVRIPMGKQDLSEIEDINDYEDIYSGRTDYSVDDWTQYIFNLGECIFRYAEQDGFKSTENFTLKVKFDLGVHCTFTNQSGLYDTPRLGIYIVVTNANGNIKNILKSEDMGKGVIAPGNVNYSASVNDSYDISMDVGDMIAIGIYAYPRQGYEYLNDYIMDITVISGALFSITSLNKIEDTTANVSLIHEALSRIVEAATNGAISVKSDYYGRTDSNVNPTPQNGAGSMRAISTGLRIRQATNPDNSEPLFSLSFADIFKGVQPIDNVGYGFVWENGQRVLRIEPYSWFYSSDNIILEINNPASKKTSIDTNNVFASFKCGYKKYETEGTNGLDAFLTEREYRTRLKIGAAKLEQVSEFVADPYSIEVTRRLANKKDTKDWRYDNDTFIFQLKESEYSIETGVSDSVNVIDPETLYNVRISPARCARRWLNRLFGWSNKPEELIFTAGKGNIIAKTEISPETELIGENDNIPNVPAILKSEITEFEYPLSMEDYNTIIRNPYGTIMLDGLPYCLYEMNFKWKSRIGSFKVLPKLI
ncbi:MAG: hypothetical protein LBQ74_12950 [Prevotella sp.]|jgi:hypothetical protein|nr:hypothetical protein [Prevotella sp.]